jgi:hypothetical protein
VTTAPRVPATPRAARRRPTWLIGLLPFLLVLLALAGPTLADASPWVPSQNSTFQWQLMVPVDESVDAQVYDIDGFTNEASVVSSLHAQGRHVICYIDAGTWEEFRPDASEFPESVLGKPVTGFPNERWIDISQLSVIEPIMAKRFEMCKEKGFDAVEPDNIEGYSNKSGFPLTAKEQLTYNLWIAGEVHSLGMAVLQKNDGEQTAEQESSFDGALTEQCNQYHECEDFHAYLAAGKPVLNAEYKVKTSKFCAADEAAGMMGARFALSLNGKRFEPCF